MANPDAASAPEPDPSSSGMSDSFFLSLVAHFSLCMQRHCDLIGEVSTFSRVNL
jgi:hypothetical protein